MKIPPGGICANCRVLAIEKPEKKKWGLERAMLHLQGLLRHKFHISLVGTDHDTPWQPACRVGAETSVVSYTCPRCPLSIATIVLEMNEMASSTNPSIKLALVWCKMCNERSSCCQAVGLYLNRVVSESTSWC